MRVLFVRPPASWTLNYEKDLGGHELELGLLYMASFLEQKGVEVAFLDMSLYHDSKTRLIDTLQKKDFDFIGLTAYTNFINTANSVAGIIKQYSKGKIVIGGAHASALPEETLKDFTNFDYLVYGEGEETLTELITGGNFPDIRGLAWRDKAEIIRNPPRKPIEHLDTLPFPARHLLDFDKYVPPPGNYCKLPSTGILSSRGCPFHCTYCSRTGTRFKNNVRFRSIGNVIREIEFCIENFGIFDFRFYDDTFVLSKKRLIRFAKELLKKKIKITWNCYSRVDTIDKEMLQIMRETGCYHIKYGVEFGNQKWLVKTKKNTTLEQARNAIKATKKAGIAAKSSFMIGMPGETVDEIMETINFAKEINSTYTTFDIFTPLPGSELFDEAREKGTLLTDDYDAYFGTPKQLLKDQLDVAILRKLLKVAYRKTYFNPKYFLHRLMHLFKNPSVYEIKILLKGVSIITGAFQKSRKVS